MLKKITPLRSEENNSRILTQYIIYENKKWINRYDKNDYTVIIVVTVEKSIESYEEIESCVFDLIYSSNINLELQK